jgi:hypothetical protein
MDQDDGRSAPRDPVPDWPPINRNLTPDKTELYRQTSSPFCARLSTVAPFAGREAGL